MRLPRVIKLGNYEIELFYSTKAMLDLEKRCGDTKSIGDWLSEEEASTGETLAKFAGIITDLANGAVFKHNAEIALGMVDGEKQKFYDETTIASLLTPADLIKAKETIFGAINDGMSYETPEGIPEPDPDLAEVESEKNA